MDSTCATLRRTERIELLKYPVKRLGFRDRRARLHSLPSMALV